MLAVSVIGFFDAAYLTIEHLKGETPPCSIVEGCAIVTTSEYAVLLGVPVALVGAIYYFLMAASLVYYLDTRREATLIWLSRFTIAGFLASLYFVSIQLFVLNAICLYCMLSAGISTILFGLGLTVNNKQT